MLVSPAWKLLTPSTGWLENFKPPTFDLDVVAERNDKYIDNSSYTLSQLFNNTWLCRYLRPKKVMIDNGSEFRQDFTPLLKYFALKHVCAKVNKPQDNNTVERLHQVIYKMILTKDIYKNI